MKYTVAQASLKGRRRENQDRTFAACAYGRAVVALADGMGGYEGGAKAAEVAVQAVSDAWQKLPARQRKVEAPAKWLGEIVARANQSVLELHGMDESLGDAGSTLVVALLQDYQYAVAWVGDSRAWLCDIFGMFQLTRDHSAVNACEDSEQMQELIEANPVAARALMRYLGMPEAELLVDTFSGELSNDGLSVLLLTSDGIHEVLEPAVVARCISCRGALSKRLIRLAKLAISNQSSDNCSAAALSCRTRTSWWQRLLWWSKRQRGRKPSR